MRALAAAYGAVVARLQEPTGWQGSEARRWMRKTVVRIGNMHLPLMPPDAGNVINERAAFVEFLDGADRYIDGLDRPARPAELAWLYLLCGYWEAPDPARLRKGLTAGDVVREETHRMSDVRKRRGEPKRLRGIAAYRAFVLTAIKPPTQR